MSSNHLPTDLATLLHGVDARTVAFDAGAAAQDRGASRSVPPYWSAFGEAWLAGFDASAFYVGKDVHT